MLSITELQELTRLGPTARSKAVAEMVGYGEEHTSVLERIDMLETKAPIDAKIEQEEIKYVIETTPIAVVVPSPVKEETKKTIKPPTKKGK